MLFQYCYIIWSEKDYSKNAQALTVTEFIYDVFIYSHQHTAKLLRLQSFCQKVST